MNNQNRTKKQEIGQIGEDLACKFVKNKGFRVVDRNYWKKWGEIDIIAEKDHIIRFIEVKTVSHETKNGVLCESYDTYLPEENVHPRKLKRMSRVIQTYLIDKDISDEKEWQFDVLAVFLDLKNKEAKMRFTEDLIL